MAGYNPASVMISNLPQSQAIFYEREFLKNLKQHTPFLLCADRKELPLNSGNSMTQFMYVPFGANIVNAAEGTVGSGITPTVLSNNAVIGQLADYASVSSLALATAIDDTLVNLEREMAYRLAQSITTQLRNTADGANIVDASVLIQKAYTGAPLVFGDLTSAGQSLRGRGVRPFADNKFVGVIHSFCVGDIKNDPSNNALVDIFKHTSEGMDKLLELPDNGDGEVQFLDFGGFKFYETSLVKQTADYLGHAGVTALRTYMFGEEGLIGISLGAKAGSQIGNGEWSNMQVMLQRNDKSTVADPSKMIGGWAAYRAEFTSSLPCDTTQRCRVIDSVSNIA